jgi:hypothetical protein
MAADEPDGWLTALDVFVGEWIAQVEVPEAPPGRCTFAWDLRGTVLVQRVVQPAAEVPGRTDDRSRSRRRTPAVSSTTSTPEAWPGSLG